jgi:hypothetical protein
MMPGMMPRSWHQLVASLAIVVFAFQSYVTQTHIHLLSTLATSQVASGAAKFQKTPAPAKRVPADDPANCPICQDIALSGHFTTPVTIPVLPPALVAIVAAPAVAAQAVIAVASHSWQGRAPPQN